MPKIATRTDAETVRPTPERMRKSAVVAAETIRAGVMCHIDLDAAPGALLERLKRYLSGEQHQFLEDYQQDLISAGVWRSPASSAYGQIRGGEQSETGAVALTRVLRIERHVIANARPADGWRCRDIMRAVAEDIPTVEYGVRPIWLPLLRRAVNVGMDWRG